MFLAELHIIVRGTRRALKRLLEDGSFLSLVKSAFKAYVVDDRVYSQDEIERWLKNV